MAIGLVSDSSGSSSEEEEKALEASVVWPFEVDVELLPFEEDLGKRLQPLRTNADVSANPIIFNSCLFIVLVSFLYRNVWIITTIKLISLSFYWSCYKRYKKSLTDCEALIDCFLFNSDEEVVDWLVASTDVDFQIRIGFAEEFGDFFLFFR